MSIRELFNRVPMQLIALFIVVAGLAYYALKRTGYIEGMETAVGTRADGASSAVGESDPNIIKETGTKKRTVIE
jgi:hypothetical protein